MFFFICVSVVLGGWREATDNAAATMDDIINGRAGCDRMQEVIANAPYTQLNISGSVQAAAAAANIDNIVANKRDLLFRMRDCVSSTSDAEVDSEGFGFSKSGTFSLEGWDVTEEENQAESRCLEEIWEGAAADDETIVLQHYSGSSGFIRGFFSNEDLNTQMEMSDESFDARLNPSYVFSTTYQKDVFLLLDLSASEEFIQEMKEGARAVISGLYDRDYAQIFTTANSDVDLESDESCALGFLRMTESNKELLMTYIDAIDDKYSGSLRDIGKIFEDAFDSLEEAINNENSGASNCQPIFLFMSDRQPSNDDLSDIRTRNLDFGARIFAYAINSATDPRGWVGGGNMYRLTCDNEGEWFNIEEPEELSDAMLQYMILIQRSREITDPVWFVRSYTYDQVESGIGLVGSLPVYRSGPSATLVVTGVVTIEFSLSEVRTYLESLARGFSFAFLTTDQGDLLLHPSYRDPDVVQRLPLYYDSSLIENSPSFKESVRGPLVREQAGDVTVTVNRPLSRGDIGTEGITSIPLKTSFFWNRVQSLPIVLVLAYTDAELRAPLLEAPRTVDWFLSTRTRQIWDEPDADVFLPPDFQESLVVDLLSTGSTDVFSVRYSTLIDNSRTFSDTLAGTARESLGDNDRYRPDSYMFDVRTQKTIQAYLNNAYAPGFNENPGMQSTTKEMSLISTIVNAYWREDYFRVCDRQPDDCAALFRYMGFSNQGLVNFPGFVDFPGSYITDSPYYLPRTRPWYQRSESNPGLTTLATPYLDAFFGGKICSICKAVFADPTRAPDDREIVGVVGIDYPYPLFHRQIMNASGCAYNRSFVDADTPLCYVMDSAGLVVISPDFLIPTYTTLGETNSDTLPIFNAEPEIAEQLVEGGIIDVSTFLNFRGTIDWLVYDEDGNPSALVSNPTDIPQENPIYTVNNTALEANGGFFSGNLMEKDGYCTSGQYTIAPMEGTSLYLIYIENYAREERDDCRTYSVGAKENVTIDNCGQNDQNYVREAPLCPNADRRESETELHRDTYAKCDEDPPKEVDYVAWDDVVAIVMVAVTAVLIFICVVLWCIIFRYRGTPVILMSSPTFIYLQFFGFILGLSTIFLWTGEPTDAQCGLRVWIAPIAFVLIVGPMFAKTYRIWKLFSGKGFFAQKISDMTVLLYVGAMMVPPLVLSLVWSIVEIPSPRLEDDHFDNDKIVYRCDGDTCRGFEGAMIGYCGFLLALGTFFAFRARKAASHFNEARYIGLSVYAVSFCGIVGVTLTYVLLGLPIAYYVVFCVTVWLGVFSTILFVYLPKLRICLFQPEKNIYSRHSSGSKKSFSQGTGTDMDD